MKKIFTLFLLLTAGALMTTALADTYNIWIGGVRATDDNKADINPTGKTAGKIYFNSNTKTLYCENVQMNTDKCCIDIETEGVKVYF